MRNKFVSTALALKVKGSQAQQINSLYKASGIGAAGLGLAALFGSATGFIPLAIGTIAWGGATINTLRKTGKFSPLPWLDDLDISQELAKLGDQGGQHKPLPSMSVREVDYLSAEEKALLYLADNCGAQLTAIYDYILSHEEGDESQFDWVLNRMIDGLIENEANLVHAHLLEQAWVETGDALPNKFLWDALDNIPEETRSKFLPLPLTKTPEIPLSMRGISQELDEERDDVVDLPVSDQYQGFEFNAFPSEPSSEEQAIPVSSTEIIGETEDRSPQQGAAVQTIDLIDKVSKQSKVRNCLFAGESGAGKGVMISNCLWELIQARPDFHIVVIDPKSDPEEQGYWDKVQGSGTTGRGRLFSQDVDNLNSIVIDAWIRECLDYFQKLPSPKLLVVDEMPILMELLGTVKNKPGLTALNERIQKSISLGDSREVKFWGVTQYVHTKLLPGYLMQQMLIMVMVSGSNQNYLNSLLKTDAVCTPPEGEELIRLLIQQSEVGRALYFSGNRTWYPAPKLKIRCLKDREGIRGESKQQQIQEQAELKEGQSELAQKLFDWLYKNAGIQYHKGIQEDGESIMIVPISDVMSHGLRHIVDGKDQTFDQGEIIKALNELLEIHLVGRTKDNTGVVLTQINQNKS